MDATTQGWTHRFPRGEAASGRLSFENGMAPRLDVRGAALGDELARCRFEGPEPRVEARRGELIVDYRGFFRWFFLGRAAPGEIEINDSMPWAVQVDGGVARSDLDLRTVSVTRFEVNGGAARVDLRLGKPKGIVPIRIRGGAARLRISHPPGVASRLRVSGGAAHLTFGSQSMGAVGGGLSLESNGWSAQGDGYDVTIAGGVAHFAIEAEGSA